MRANEATIIIPVGTNIKLSSFSNLYLEIEVTWKIDRKELFIK
jgi:hypothetical protein